MKIKRFSMVLVSLLLIVSMTGCKYDKASVGNDAEKTNNTKGRRVK
ncbi:hypothetical protein AN2V17_46480 [Vallitalea sp. AN17-2]|uniref:Uncharacterized protein n=1 Tax=Vallitalea maricola TaxID=3074433 RepID=A0ACB5UR92_9FIRM|nr:hypothetical protein AN2V17_46480 [Vallitalea sp. AN17-2]